MFFAELHAALIVALMSAGVPDRSPTGEVWDVPERLGAALLGRHVRGFRSRWCFS